MKHKQSLGRFAAVSVLVALLAVSVSAVSWAFDPDERVLNEDGDWSLNVKAGKYKDKKATPSSAARYRVGDDMTASPSNMLEQTGFDSGSIDVEWFRILVDGETARDSDRPHIAMKEGREIPSDGKLKYKLKAIFNVDDGGFEAGGYVEWRLGVYTGLSLPEESWEDVVIDGIPFGEACLSYEEDGTVWLRTVFSERIREHPKIYIEYTYESGFLPVYEKTPLDFQFPGWEGAITAVLLPVMRPDPSDPDLSGPDDPEITEMETTEQDNTETEPETTLPRPTEPITEPETTALQPTEPIAEPETTAALPQPGRPSGGGSFDRGSGSSAIHTTAAETISASVESALQEPEPVDLESVYIVPKSLAPIDGSVPDDRTKDTETSGKSPGREAESDGEDSLPEPAGIEIRASYLAPGAARGTGMAKNGEALSCVVEVVNTGDTPAKDLRIRNLLPKHTSFLSASDGGTWGILAGQERVTWKLDVLEPGESRTFGVELLVYPCTPAGYLLEQTVLWQTDDGESVNSSKNPANGFAGQGITVE